LANPQKENGHTALANELWDALAKYRLSGEEWKCLIVIIRKTYGWHKKSDRISLSQFAELADMKKQSASRALRNLSAKMLIVVSKFADGETLEYRLEKDFDKWLPISKKAYCQRNCLSGVSKNADKSVSEIAKAGSAKMLNTKETPTKEKKETLTKETLEFFETFWKCYPRRIAKAEARKSFLKIKPDAELLEKILSAVEFQKKNWDDPKYIPHPSTWLNQERWNDERVEYKNAGKGIPATIIHDAKWEKEHYYDSWMSVSNDGREAIEKMVAIYKENDGKLSSENRRQLAQWEDQLAGRE
jgi:phage replication O-like protein O